MDAMELGQTHRGTERRYPSVSGTDGQVVEGNGLPVQLYILSDPQHTLHRRNHELPWEPSEQACISLFRAPFLQPAFLMNARAS